MFLADSLVAQPRYLGMPRQLRQKLELPLLHTVLKTQAKQPRATY